MYIVIDKTNDVIVEGYDDLDREDVVAIEDSIKQNLSALFSKEIEVETLEVPGSLSELIAATHYKTILASRMNVVRRENNLDPWIVIKGYAGYNRLADELFSGIAPIRHLVNRIKVFDEKTLNEALASNSDLIEQFERWYSANTTLISMMTIEELTVEQVTYILTEVRMYQSAVENALSNYYYVLSVKERHRAKRLQQLIEKIGIVESYAGEPTSFHDGYYWLDTSKGQYGYIESIGDGNTDPVIIFIKSIGELAIKIYGEAALDEPLAIDKNNNYWDSLTESEQNEIKHRFGLIYGKKYTDHADTAEYFVQYHNSEEEDSSILETADSLDEQSGEPDPDLDSPDETSTDDISVGLIDVLCVCDGNVLEIQFERQISKSEETVNAE